MEITNCIIYRSGSIHHKHWHIDSHCAFHYLESYNRRRNNTQHREAHNLVPTYRKVFFFIFWLSVTKRYTSFYLSVYLLESNYSTQMDLVRTKYLIYYYCVCTYTIVWVHVEVWEQLLELVVFFTFRNQSSNSACQAYWASIFIHWAISQAQWIIWFY